MDTTLRLTKRVVDATTPETKVHVIWDSQISGFGLKVHPTGRKVYFFKYRVGGGRSARRREPVIGVHGSITPDEARRIASDWAHEVAVGNDPAAIRDQQRAAPTMSDLFARYLTDHAEKYKKPSSVRNDRRIISNTLLPSIGTLKVGDISRDEIAKLHASMADKPYEANRTLALVSKIFNLSELWEYRPDGSNPCRHIRRYKEHRRQRLLSEQDLMRLGATLNQAENNGLPDENGNLKQMNPSAISALRLLIFTGARTSEVLGLKWSWINWNQRRAELPDSKTGSKFVYLPPAAIQVLTDLQSTIHDETFVIKGKYPGTHLVNLKDPWRVIRRNAELDDLRVHDLRHCFASIGAMRGMSLTMIGALLGHQDVATTQRYAHLSDDPIRSAGDEIGGHLAGLLGKAQKPA